MKRILTMALALSLSTAATVQASTHSNRSLINELDEAISNKSIYHAEKENTLRQLKLHLDGTSDIRRKYEIANTIYKSYLHYQADSARQYINRKVELARQLNDSNLDDEISINRAEVRGVMGMYNDAFKHLSNINATHLSKENRIYYYKTFRACYGWIADYTLNGHLKETYTQKTEAYRDSILMYIEPGYERDIVWSEKKHLAGDTDMALECLQRTLDKLKGGDAAAGRYLNYAYYTLSEIYRSRGERELQEYYLTLTSIADLKASICEYASLQKLAQLMYEDGDVRRAYDYLSCSMEDAVFCNARLRFIEVAQFFPIIDRAHNLEEQRDKERLRIFLIVLGVLGLALIVLVCFLVRWNGRLNAIRLSLSETNSRMIAVNHKLEETGRIKDVYIAKYLDRCANYLNKLDSYRHSLVKFAMASRIDELFKAIKSDDFINEERRNFYIEFDKSFLDLFPNFVDSFNNLLVEEARIYPKPGELLTTELRIFALIRLGVTDSNRIAIFLGYSLTTIYNYRSKVRNRAIDKETFEQEVMML